MHWTPPTHLGLHFQGHEYVGVTKSLFKVSRINIKVMCDPEDPSRPPNITIAWLLRKAPCYNEYSITKVRWGRGKGWCGGGVE